MNKNFIRIVCLLDRSGSMQAVHGLSIDSFNEFVNGLKVDNHGYCTFKLIQFDDKYETHYDLPLAQVPMLTDKTFIPRGSTAYLDALGRAMDELGSELRHTPEPNRPGKVIFVTLSDGKENASSVYTHGQIAEMIKHQMEVYSWEFMYLGANHNALEFAKSINLPQSRVLYYAASVADPEAMHYAFNAAAQSVNLMRGASVSGQSTSSVAGFTDEDRIKSTSSAGTATSGAGTATTTTAVLTELTEEQAVSSR